MPDLIVCPVCETQNPPDASVCEVCGERLAPAQPGEEIPPEENVAAMIAASEDRDDAQPAEQVGAGGVTSAAPAAESTEPEDGYDAAVQVEQEAYSMEDYAGEVPEEPIDEIARAQQESGQPHGAAPSDQEQATPSEYPESTEARAGGFELEEDPTLGYAATGDPVPVEGDPEPLDPGNQPEILYSPMTGEAYPRGTPEFQEGFGPMGEELVAEPPANVARPEGAGPEQTPSVEGAYEPDEEALTLQGEDPSVHMGEQAPPAEAVAASPGPDAPNMDPEPEELEAGPPSSFAPSGPNPDAELPQPGPHDEAATLTVYHQREPVMTYDIETDETLIGREDIRADIHPDMDLTQWDTEQNVSRKHAYVYRQNKNYTLYAVSNGGVQLNNDLLELGDKRELSDGDVIIIAGFLAMKFELPEAS